MASEEKELEDPLHNSPVMMTNSEQDSSIEEQQGNTEKAIDKRLNININKK